MKKIETFFLVSLCCLSLGKSLAPPSHDTVPTQDKAKISAKNSTSAAPTEVQNKRLNPISYIVGLPQRVQDVHHKYVDKYCGPEDASDDAPRHTEALKELTEQEGRLSGSSALGAVVAAAAGITNQFAQSVYEIYEIATGQTNRTLRQVWNSLKMDTANNFTGIRAGLTGREPSSFPSYTSNVKNARLKNAFMGPSLTFKAWLDVTLRGENKNR